MEVCTGIGSAICDPHKQFLTLDVVPCVSVTESHSKLSAERTSNLVISFHQYFHGKYMYKGYVKSRCIWNEIVLITESFPQ